MVAGAQEVEAQALAQVAGCAEDKDCGHARTEIMGKRPDLKPRDCVTMSSYQSSRSISEVGTQRKQ